ncbi:hypothetical protein ACFVZ3_08990 [Kitasatospora purpeofusca]|uniref:hypothetical protein n=1 Tax=Kitasatospora purpeofusca TaxID=67352 RepID=UPI0036A90E2A
MGITQIDWSNAGFIRTYTMAFGASVVLTVVLWLVAVAKRAIQGVNPVQALGESIGYLLLSVMTSAFAPLAIAYITQAFDGIADAMLAPATQDLPKIGAVLGSMLALLMVIPGGQPIVLAIGFFLLMAILGVWLELIARNALIYTGLVFGPTVFAGLVDKDLWRHTKHWFGIIAGVIASKYVTFTTLALASALLAGKSSENASVAQAFGTSLTAAALLFLALYLPFQVAKFIPILGDQVQDVFSSRKQMEGGLSNMTQSAKSSFGDIKSKLGGGSDEDNEEIGDGDEIDAAAGAGGETAPGIGLAKAAQERGEQEVDATAKRGAAGATAATDQGNGSSPTGTPDQGDPNQTQHHGTTTAANPADGPDPAGAPDHSTPDQGDPDQTQHHGTTTAANPADGPDPAGMPHAPHPHQGATEGTAANDASSGGGVAASVEGSAASGASSFGSDSYGEDATPVASTDSGPSGSAAASTSAAPTESFSDGSPVEEPPDEGE